MVTEKGIVTKVRHTTAWIKTTRTSACESCSERDMCHTMGGGKEMEVEAINEVGAKVGDNVIISFETGSLVKVSFLIYIFPIISMIVGAMIGQKIAPMYQLDISTLSVICSFSFLFFAFLLIRWVGKKLSYKKSYRAKIIRIKSPEIQT